MNKNLICNLCSRCICSVGHGADIYRLHRDTIGHEAKDLIQEQDWFKSQQTARPYRNPPRKGKERITITSKGNMHREIDTCNQ